MNGAPNDSRQSKEASELILIQFAWGQGIHEGGVPLQLQFGTGSGMRVQWKNTLGRE